MQHRVPPCLQPRRPQSGQRHGEQRRHATGPLQQRMLTHGRMNHTAASMLARVHSPIAPRLLVTRARTHPRLSEHSSSALKAAPAAQTWHRRGANPASEACDGRGVAQQRHSGRRSGCDSCTWMHSKWSESWQGELQSMCANVMLPHVPLSWHVQADCPMCWNAENVVHS